MNPTLINRLIFILIVVALYSQSFGQSRGSSAWQKYRHEASVGYGINNVYAALGERDHLGFAYVLQRSTFNGSYRYYLTKNIAARASLSHGYARKNDKSLNFNERINERIDYLSTISEFSLLGEYHFIDETAKGKKSKVRRARGGMSKGLNVGISAFTGISFSYFRPFGELNGQMMEFKPITSPLTVPNNQSYKRGHLFVPVGANVRLILTENLRLGLEGGYRFGFREYINNVSGVYARDPEYTNPEPSVLDPHYFGIITFSKEKAPIADLASETGKRNYLFAFITFSYRFKA